MTLKEKFENILKQAKIHFIKSDSKECEEVADDYAIEFAKWIKTDWACDERWSKITDSKELLKIFKKEKGL